MPENQEQGIEPEEARGRTLKEKAKEIDPRIAVTRHPEDAERLLADGASAVLIEGFGDRSDYSELAEFALKNTDRKKGTEPDSDQVRENKSPSFFRGESEKEKGSRILRPEAEVWAGIESEIENNFKDESVRKILYRILADAKKLRALFPKKRLMLVSLLALRGGADGTRPQVWHTDGDPVTRVIKTYAGPETEFASQDKRTKVTPPAGTVSIFTGGPHSAMHRGPAVPKNTIRIRLQLELE